MIEELTMIKDMVGDLTQVGGWVVAAILGYKLLTSMVLMLGGGWLANSFISKMFSYLSADISKAEADIILNGAQKAEAKNKELIADAYEKDAKHRADLDEIKAMYKVLKESHSDKPADE